MGGCTARCRSLFVQLFLTIIDASSGSIHAHLSYPSKHPQPHTAPKVDVVTMRTLKLVMHWFHQDFGRVETKTKRMSKSMFKKTSLSRQMLRGTDEHLSHPTKTKTNRPDKHPPPHTHATSSRGLGSKDHEGLRSKTLESVCWALRAFGREELKKKNEEEVENASMLIGPNRMDAFKDGPSRAKCPCFVLSHIINILILPLTRAKISSLCNLYKWIYISPYAYYHTYPSRSRFNSIAFPTLRLSLSHFLL